MTPKENTAVFSTDHVLDIPEIDKQHETLFTLLDKISSSSFDRYRPLDDDAVDAMLDVLTEVRDFALVHFDTEEALMTEVVYPELEAQQAAHERFLDDLARLEGELMNGSSLPPVKIHQFLTLWCDEHILVMDKPFSNFYKKNNK